MRFKSIICGTIDELRYKSLLVLSEYTKHIQQYWALLYM